MVIKTIMIKMKMIKTIMIKMIMIKTIMIKMIMIKMKMIMIITIITGSASRGGEGLVRRLGEGNSPLKKTLFHNF